MKNFKLLSIFLTLALCAGFSSCSKDDDEPEKDLTSVVGTWQFKGNVDFLGTPVPMEITSVYNTDLTFSETAKMNGVVMSEISGTYVYDNETKELTETYIDDFFEEEVVSTSTITKLTTKQMVVDSDEYGQSLTFKKK